MQYLCSLQNKYGQKSIKIDCCIFNTYQIEKRKMGMLFVFIVRSLCDKEFTTHSTLDNLVIVMSCCMSPHWISPKDFLAASIARVNFSGSRLSRVILYHWFYRASLFSGHLVIF